MREPEYQRVILQEDIKSTASVSCVLDAAVGVQDVTYVPSTTTEMTPEQPKTASAV